MIQPTHHQPGRSLRLSGARISPGGRDSKVFVNLAAETPIWGRFSEDGIPWFSEQPTSVTADCAANAIFSIYPALGYGGLNYQWRHNGAPIDSGPTGHGSTIVTNGVNFHIIGVTNQDAGTYDCVLSNGCGSSTSFPATLTLGIECCAADFNHDGTINPDDLADYINCYFSQPPCPLADFNTDAAINPDDLADYINAYFGSSGCP